MKKTSGMSASTGNIKSRRKGGSPKKRVNSRGPGKQGGVEGVHPNVLVSTMNSEATSTNDERLAETQGKGPDPGGPNFWPLSREKV